MPKWNVCGAEPNTEAEKFWTIDAPSAEAAAAFARQHGVSVSAVHPVPNMDAAAALDEMVTGQAAAASLPPRSASPRGFVLQPKKRKNRAWHLLWTVIPIIFGYFYFSWQYDEDAAKLLQQVLNENEPSGANQTVVVKEVSFTEPFILSNFRHGNAWLEIDGKPKTIEFSATGNGLWKRNTVEISNWQMLSVYSPPPGR